jgi:D-galactarolactone cycloisomerase
MKIVDVTLTEVRYPAPHPVRHGYKERLVMNATIVQVVTDEGIVGIGDATQPTEMVISTFEQLRPLIIGQNPLDVERLWALMARGLFGFPASDMLGGIDTALWDIVGKAANLPLYRVFGAFRDRVPCYIAPSMRQPDQLMEDMAAYQKRGFMAAKLRLGLGPVGWAAGPRDLTSDIAILERSRDLLGPDFAIAADTDRTYDHEMAARIAPVVNETRLAWFEEPLPDHFEREQYIREMQRLQQVVHVPLAGGQLYFKPGQFDDLINRSAVEIVQPDVCRAGGLTPLRKIAAMAAGHGISFMPHVSCQVGADILVIAAAHVLGSTPNGLWACYQAYDTPLRTDLLREPVQVVDGEIVLPDKPGLGIELDPAALKHYAVKT